MQNKYFIITYGCQMNHSDSERIATTLENNGYKEASKMDEADLIVINMCSVRQSAVDRVYGKIKEFAKLKAKNEKLKVILTGCILKKDGRKFAEYFDFILNIRDLPRWPKILNTKYRILNTNYYLKIQPKYSSFPLAYIPISTGCNNFCTYCVVPYTRGPEIYRPVKDIVKEVKELVKKGYKEIWLLGQNVNSYKSEIRNPKSEIKSKIINFAELLREINNIPGNFWIRFTSSHPKDFSDELIEAMSRCEKVTPYLNLPVQSGDNEILRKMNRNYTVEDYKNIIEKIRKKISNITLSTDVIVGFPGETRKHFENTVRLFKEIRFDMAYISQYSPRPGTAAFRIKDDVPREEKKKREKELTEILEKTALGKNKKYIGKTVKVLVIKHKISNMKHFYIGKTLSHKTVRFQVFHPASERSSVQSKGSKFQDIIGKFIKVKIIDALPWGLLGKQAA